MYKDPILAKYEELIRANSGGAIKAYYHGDPIRLPASNLPCAILAKRETRVGPVTNAEDEHGIGLSLTVIADVRKDLSTEENIAKAVEGVSTLYDIIEGRNADYSLKDTSILDILRGNLLVDATHGLRTDLGSITRVDYGQAERVPGEWTVEARVDFVCAFQQVR